MKVGFHSKAQAFPDAPNHDGFPNTIIGPGDFFKSSLMLRFEHEG